MTGRSKKEIFSYLHDRVQKKLNRWKEKTLSQIAKEVLIKSIVQGIPTYTMSVFLLPPSITCSITSLIRNFWQSGDDKHKKICWKAQVDLCQPKSKEGLDFRDLGSFNLALLCKQGWRITKNPLSLLLRVMQAKYYPLENFSSASLIHRPSHVWIGLILFYLLLDDVPMFWHIYWLLRLFRFTLPIFGQRWFHILFLLLFKQT